MTLRSDSNNSLSLIFYSSLFLIISELILLKISEQLFFLFSYLPLAFLCLIFKAKGDHSNRFISLNLFGLFKNF